MTGDRGVGEDTDAEDDSFKEEDEQDTIVPTNHANTPELVSPSMMSTHRQFEQEPQALIPHRSHPGMIRTTNPQHIEEAYADHNYGRSLSFQHVHSPNIQDPYRASRGFVANVSPGFQSPQQNMYQAPWSNGSPMGISTNFCATSSPASALPPATAFQLPAPQTPHNMMVPRMHQPFELPHQRYDTAPALGQLRTGSLSHPHQMQQSPTGYHEFIQDPNPYQQPHESGVKEEQQHQQQLRST
jgi:hypothetical protein